MHTVTSSTVTVALACDAGILILRSNIFLTSFSNTRIHILTYFTLDHIHDMKQSFITQFSSIHTSHITQSWTILYPSH